jgi:hypothetical protein
MLAIGILSVVPALVVGLLFRYPLGHRPDYLGHYAAGYGGTLAVAILAMAELAPAGRPAQLAWGIVAVTLVCIVAGGFAEATVFRIAKFDEVDFCNQSLGAVLAGVVVLVCAKTGRPTRPALYLGILVGLAWLVAGAYFAFNY